MDEIEAASDLDTGDSAPSDDDAERLASDTQHGTENFGDGSVKF